MLLLQLLFAIEARECKTHHYLAAKDVSRMKQHLPISPQRVTKSENEKSNPRIAVLSNTTVNLEFTVPAYFVPLGIAKSLPPRTAMRNVCFGCVWMFLTSDKRACSQIDPFIGVLLSRLYCATLRLDCFVQLFDAIGR
ncbi:hypothetical protein AVEN_56504-1 [Araneus ventricosus]|uniref:Uncharacterized protein n=1 Tax=Araneus ventricosus TaxID=182803 RepID=A0A4Y2JZ87_ARAVE|nr:hypothetical protein AVEN_56504-1 [Araneus ventricosus]